MLADLVNGLAGDAAVECDEVHTLLGVQADHVDEVFGGQGVQIPLIVDDAVIDRHSADHHRTLRGELPAEGAGVAVAGQVHDGLRPHVHGGEHLLHLHVVVLAVPGDAQVDIDLGAEHGADALGVQAGMQAVGGDDHLARRHQGQQLLGGHPFLFGHGLQFRRDDAPAGGVHLCGVSTIHFKFFPKFSDSLLSCPAAPTGAWTQRREVPGQRPFCGAFCCPSDSRRLHRISRRCSMLFS